MKIVYYSSHPNLALNSPSGYGTHMREMIAAFEAYGHEVFPVIMGGIEPAKPARTRAPRGKRWVKRLVPAFGWESLKDYLLINKDLAFERFLYEKLEEIQPDLVYERASCLQLSGVHAAGRYGVPHVLEMNAPYVEERKDHFAISSAFERRAISIEKEQLASTDKAVVVSHVLKNYFVNKHGLPMDKFVVVPNAVDPGKVVIDPSRVAEIKAMPQLHGKVVVGFVGSLFKWHGVDQLVKATKLLKDTGYNVALLVVGGGAILPELQALAQNLSVNEDVVFTDSVPHAAVFDYLAAMDITVLANSHWYGSPVKLFEYGALAKPIVAPGNGPVREVITAEVDGLLIENEFDLVRHLRRLINDPDLRDRLARSFHRKVMQDHTWQRNAARVVEEMGVLEPALTN